MATKAFRLPLLLMLALFAFAFLATERVAAQTPTCDHVGTGFYANAPLKANAKTLCGTACQFQNAVWCTIGFVNWVYDCVDDGSGPHPANVQSTISYCEFCPGCGMICC